MIKYDKKYNYISYFNKKTGAGLRTGILDANGKDTGVDPFMGSFPELIDIGIMGHCIHGSSGLCIKSGVQCYQNGLAQREPNMTLENFKRIADECKGKVFQFALGGRGDPDQHENFKEILEYCSKVNIVPNFTSSGLGFTNEIVSLCKTYCGAVAISEYRAAHTEKAVSMLVEAGVKTNLHYVLGNNTIDEAISKLKTGFYNGINAVIFLLHKPVGLGTQANVLQKDDPKVKEFFSLINNRKFNFKIGFDSCSVPGLLNFTDKILKESIDTCEAGRWSMYITSDMKALPCSFDNQDLHWAYDISNDSIVSAWNSEIFEDFRSSFKTSCPGCDKREMCLGGCPIKPQIVLCGGKNED